MNGYDRVSEEKAAKLPPHFYMPADGELLFHYTNASAALSILAGETLWLSDFSCMNDPDEYIYARECYLEVFQDRPVFVDMVPRLLAIFALLGLENNTRMLIGCLSPTDDDPGQWDRYADDAAGCVIGIDAEFLSDWAGVAIRRVVYDRSTLDRFVGAGLKMLQTEYEINPDDRDGLLELARYFVSDLFAFKRAEHCNEREIRISRMVLRDPKAPGGLRDHGGNCPEGPVEGLLVRTRQGRGPTPYLALPLRNGMRRGIRSVTLGTRFPKDCTPEAQALFSALPPGVSVRRMTTENERRT